MARILISMPRKAAPNGIIEIKTLIAHPMESGYRVGSEGRLIPRDIITLFTVSYGGAEIFRADFSPAIAANPFVSFFTTARASGPVVFRWVGDNGFEASETVMLEVGT